MGDSAFPTARFGWHGESFVANLAKICRSFTLNLDKNEPFARTALSSLTARVFRMRPKRAAGTGQVMRFLLRMAFWLCIVLVLLPSGGTNPAPKADISAGDALSAAKAAMADAQKFCDRQPGACVFGSQAAIALGHRAQAGAKMIYEFLNEQLGPSETGPATTSSMRIGGSLGARPSQQTLNPADITPVWRGPQPRREASSERPA